MMGLPAALSAVAGRAALVLDWDQQHRFCGACGTPTEHQAGERARRCPACGHTAYPRISPAMMALIWRPGEVLLARAPHFVNRMYSALAGFVEAGESLEDCVHREVAEEVGLTVTDLRYYGSQSWPFPHSLMVAFTARWTGGTIVPQAGEIEHAAWFPLDALPNNPPRWPEVSEVVKKILHTYKEDARSWERIMTGLDKHYGTDASHDDPTVKQLSTRLQANAGTYKRVSEEPPQDRLTRSAWFERKHDEIPASVWKHASIKSAANCAACHTGADRGDFDDDNIRMPAGVSLGRRWFGHD
mgnify:CR=1 FL=1